MDDASTGGTSFGSAVHNINEEVTSFPPQNLVSQPSGPNFNSLIYLGAIGPDDEVDNQPNVTSNGDDTDSIENIK